MILADKIIELRKKAGLSQEELAEKMNVSRQAVSKWEGAQSTPDLARILQLSEIFGVSTDYLLKDEIEAAEAPEAIAAEDTAVQSEPLYRVSMEEANSFLEANERRTKLTALGVVLCIISVTPTMLLGEIFKNKLADAIGSLLLFVIVAAGTALFIAAANIMKPFGVIRSEMFETEYGVSGMVRDRQGKYQPVYIRLLITGIVMLILSFSPVLIFDVLEVPEWVSEGLAPAAMFGLAAFGVYLIMRAVMKNGAYTMLIEERRVITKVNREKTGFGEVMGIFWLLVLAVYIAYSFITMNWGMSWVILIIGALFSGIISLVWSLIKK